MRIPWKFKSLIFRIVEKFDVPVFIYFLQKYITKRSRLGQHVINDIMIRHRDAINEFQAGGFCFEFGAGKNIAQNLFLSHVVDHQLVVDLNPMLDLELVEKARFQISGAVKLRSVKPITSAKDLIEYGIEYRAPFDASDTGLPNVSLDACISTNTFEHIPIESIEKILSELHRTLKDSGILSICIDYSDHYAHTDPSICDLNFLRFKDEEWSRFNHTCHYQNRLRHYDYKNLFRLCGFKVIREELKFSDRPIPKVICDRFEGHEDSWAATSAYMLVVKQGSSSV